MYCCMTAIMVSKRGTITLPPNLRKKLGLDQVSQPMVLVEEREGGLFLQSATPVPLRKFSKAQIEGWMKQDELEMSKFRGKKS